MFRYKRLSVLILIALAMLTISSCSEEVVETDNRTQIEYYFFNTCGDCDPEGDFLDSFEEIMGFTLDENQYKIVFKNVYYPSNVEPFGERMTELNLSYTLDDVPIVIIDGKAIKAKTDEEAIADEEFISVIEDSNKPNIIFFTSPGCKECEKVKVLFEDNNLNENINIMAYSISDSQSIAMSRKYISEYSVSEGDQLTPIVYVGDEYYSAYKGIKGNFDTISSFTGKTPVLDAEEEESQSLTIWEIVTSFLIGLLNGFNPCSISMTIMLLSILVANGKNIKTTGIAFAVGKFVGFLLLGTVLFNMISLINYTLLTNITKIFLIILSVFLAVMNAIDAISIKKNKLGKIRLQLPQSVIKFNHKLIEKYGSDANALLAVLIGFLLGIVISAGEFLCTGQLYLATIVTLANSGNGILSYIQLALYSLGFVSVLLVVVIVADRGVNSFKLSNFFREKMFAIKIANMIFFVLMLLATIFFL